MDEEFKSKYERYKMVVKVWEHGFKKKAGRIPSKHDIRDAPMNVRQSYKMYYQMKTSYLSSTLTECMDELDDEDSFEMLGVSQMDSNLDISSSVQELLDPNNVILTAKVDEEVVPKSLFPIQDQPGRSYEAAEDFTQNQQAWGENLNKPKPKVRTLASSKQFKSKLKLNVDPVATKPLRNPRKSLVRTQSKAYNGFENGASNNREVLPDLETILLEKSRSDNSTPIKKSVSQVVADNQIKTAVDSAWLDRNASCSSLDKLEPFEDYKQNPIHRTLSTTSSFGLSNLNMRSFTSRSSLATQESIQESTQDSTQDEAIKYHTLDVSDSEVIGNSEDESESKKRVPILHIAKKRRLAEERAKMSTMSQERKDPPMTIIPEKNELIVGTPVIIPVPKIVPEKPKRMSIRKPKLIINHDEISKTTEASNDGDFNSDDSDKDPTFNVAPVAREASVTPPPLLVRKKSVIKRSKESITKITKKATKLLTRAKGGAKKSKPEEKEEDAAAVEVQEEINYFIDSDLSQLETVPRVSQSELLKNEKLFDNFIKDHSIAGPSKVPIVIANEKQEAKKIALQKKIASGTLNDNYVRVNLKKKVFVRGKKAFNFSRYKKTIWKSKKAAALSGPDMDMRGCDGGVLRCHNCGGVGHFEQHCKQKGDNLMPLDAELEDQSPFPTLDEAATMASDKLLLVHSTRIDKIPLTANEIWKHLDGIEENEEDTELMEVADKENKQSNDEVNDKIVQVAPPVNAYIGHSIPQDFLKKSGLLDVTAGKDEIKPLYNLNNDGSLIATPDEVNEALKMFGHPGFRKGQEKAVMRILSGVSTLVTLSTGSGKTLCYQLPAYLYRKKMRCITLVISPLVSLMEDQVHGVPSFLNAQCLHTNQTPKQRELTMENIKNGLVDIILVSPEAVVSGEKATGFGSLLRQLPPIAFACIDEAHCVSQWSHNFRPSYLMICRVLREKLGVKTVLGLTATATKQTRESIVRHLGIPDGVNGIISDIPLPDNLILTVSKDENRDRALIELLRGERFAKLQSIIIYCTRRDECERISGFLRTCLQDNKKEEEKPSKKRKRTNWNAEAYHAGLPASRRRTIQNAFMGNEMRVVVATIAFGMGINKSDIRGIIHYNMPKSFESYVQEVGRAGRDGKPAHCHVFLDPKGQDISELRRHIYANSIDRHVIRKLLQKVFIPCACGKDLKKITNSEVEAELKNVNFNTSDDEMDISVDESSFEAPKKQRICPGHEVSFSVEQTVQLLDIPQENISTLLCYLELHEQRYIKVLGNAYTMCKIFCYGGAKYLKLAARTSPPLAMAIAMDLKKGMKHDDTATIEFCVIDIAAAIGWDSGVVKYQLKQLEWTMVNGASKRSSISVAFSDIGFRLKAPGDLTDDEQDMALDLLQKRSTTQEKAQSIQLQIIFNSLDDVAFPKYTQCAMDNCPTAPSEKLKITIRNYFQSSLPMDVKIQDDSCDTADQEIVSDIRQMISMYPDNNFSGRSLARLFHGISSPCYPAVIWGRCKFWRAHTKVNFNRVVSLGNMEIVRMRRIDATD